MTENEENQVGTPDEKKEPETPETDVDPNLDETVDVDDLKKTAQTALAQKKSWREKAVDPETGKTFKELYESMRNPPKKETSKNEQPARELDVKEYTDLRVEGYSQEEITFLTNNRTGDQPLREVLKNPYVKSAIDSMRSERSSDESTPEPSPSSIKINDKKWNDMSEDERRKNFSTYFHKLTGKNK